MVLCVPGAEDGTFNLHGPLSLDRDAWTDGNSPLHVISSGDQLDLLPSLIILEKLDFLHDGLEFQNNLREKT